MTGPGRRVLVTGGGTGIGRAIHLEGSDPAGMTDDSQKEASPKERLINVTLDDSAVIRRSPEVEHERAVAIYDLRRPDAYELPAGEATQ